MLEALRASGASWWQVVFQGVVPEKVNEMLSWTFIRFEINFVNAVAVGAVAGAGGIGYQLFLAGSFYYTSTRWADRVLVPGGGRGAGSGGHAAAQALHRAALICLASGRAWGLRGGRCQSLKQSSLRCETRLVGTTPGPAAPRPLAC